MTIQMEQSISELEPIETPSTEIKEETNQPPKEIAGEPEITKPEPDKVDVPTEQGSDPEVVSTDSDSAVTVTEEYVPNYSYKVAQKELEFDDRLRAIIKDKDTEEYVRDLVTRAEGLPLVKERLTEKEQYFNDLQSRYHEVETESSKYKTGFERLGSLAKNDLYAFKQAWNISDENIIGLAKDIINATENPQLAQQKQQAFQDQLTRWQSEDEMSVQRQSVDTSTRELHEMRMELALSKPQVSEFQKSLDALRGDGFFEKKVKEYGTLKYHAGEYVQPKDAVGFVMEEYEVFLKQKDPATVAPEAQPSTRGGPEVVRDAPPIPNLGPGRTGSPVRKKPNWEDLKRMAGM